MEREEYKMLSERALTEYSSRSLCPCCDFTGMTMCDYVRNYLALSCSTMKCMEYFKYYLCTKCTYSWSITTWWEFWIVSWEEGEEDREVVLSEKYWTLISSLCEWFPLLLSVREMGVAFSTIFFWSCISNPTQGLILYHIYCWEFPTVKWRGGKGEVMIVVENVLIGSPLFLCEQNSHFSFLWSWWEQQGPLCQAHHPARLLCNDCLAGKFQISCMTMKPWVGQVERCLEKCKSVDYMKKTNIYAYKRLRHHTINYNHHHHPRWVL